MSIQTTPGGYHYVPGRNGKPGRSFAKLRDAQIYDQELNRCVVCVPETPDLTDVADHLADTVEAYLEAMNLGVMHAEMGLRQALNVYREARKQWKS